VIYDIEQGTDNWHAARRGKATASRIADIIAKTKTGWGASRKNYLAQLVAERLTGTTAESFTSAAMRWGTETEPQARAAYEFFRDQEVSQIGFVDHPTIAMAGASPDGLIDDDGSLECKCPNTATHIETLLGAKIPDNYIVQVQWQMACCDRAWCDWMSFDPRMPQELQMFVKRVKRNKTRIKELEKLVRDFLAEVDETEGKLRALYNAKGKS
jgi:putative phage-type endonuclease